MVKKERKLRRKIPFWAHLKNCKDCYLAAFVSELQKVSEIICLTNYFVTRCKSLNKFKNIAKLQITFNTLISIILLF